MEEALVCSICYELYDFTEHLPKTLRCGHTFCLCCIQKWYGEAGRLQCPNDSEIFYMQVEALSDNQALKSIIQTREVRCHKHKAIVYEYCLKHWTELCEACNHRREDCVVKTIAENLQEITTSVHSRIADLQQAIPQSLISRETRTELEKRFSKPLTAVIPLLHGLEAKLALVCESCGGVADYALHLASMAAFCRNCTTPSEELISLEGMLLSDVTEQLMCFMPTLLVNCNFCDVPTKLLQALQRRVELFPKDFQEACRELFRARKPRADFQSLPEQFNCPMCLTTFKKQSCRMRVLPCRQGLHVFCEMCAEVQGPIIYCPLDHFEYFTSPDQLAVLQPEPKPMLQPVHKPKPVPTKPQGPPSTGLPEPYQGYCYLNRFESVLPAWGSSVESRQGNNKAWGVNFEKKQVEVFSFNAHAAAYLIGLTLATPLDPGVVVLVESLVVYQGSKGRGFSLFSMQGSEGLEGGYSVCQDVFFPAPFKVKPYTQYTLKIKIRPPPGSNDKSCYIYRGSPYQRPDVWIGSDATLWEFGAVDEVEQGEYVSGQGNLSGPVLRLYYTPA